MEDDRLTLYELIRDKISIFFVKTHYNTSNELFELFCNALGDKMVWNLFVKGLFHHLHYIPKSQLNKMNDQLSMKIQNYQSQQIKKRELREQIQKFNKKRKQIEAQRQKRKKKHSRVKSKSSSEFSDKSENNRFGETSDSSSVDTSDDESYTSDDESDGSDSSSGSSMTISSGSDSENSSSNESANTLNSCDSSDDDDDDEKEVAMNGVIGGPFDDNKEDENKEDHNSPMKTFSTHDKEKEKKNDEQKNKEKEQEKQKEKNEQGTKEKPVSNNTNDKADPNMKTKTDIEKKDGFEEMDLLGIGRAACNEDNDEKAKQQQRQQKTQDIGISGLDSKSKSKETDDREKNKKDKKRKKRKGNKKSKKEKKARRKRRRKKRRRRQSETNGISGIGRQSRRVVVPYLNIEFRNLSDLSEDVWIKIFQYLPMASVISCERVNHYFENITKHANCFSNFKYEFSSKKRNSMFNHYQRLNGINDVFVRFRHSRKMHLIFYTKENYEFRLLTAFGDRFRNIQCLIIEVNRSNTPIDLSQLVKKYSNFFISIREVAICVHGLGAPVTHPHQRMMQLYRTLVCFVLIRCAFLRTLILNYSLITQCYRHISSCLELNHVLCINSKSAVDKSIKQVEKQDASNIVLFNMSQKSLDWAQLSAIKQNSQNPNIISGVNINNALELPSSTNNTNVSNGTINTGGSANASNTNGNQNGNHGGLDDVDVIDERLKSDSLSLFRSDSKTEEKTDNNNNSNNANNCNQLNDLNDLSDLKDSIENHIQREIKMVFYRRHIRFSFLSYFGNHIRSLHIHNSSGFSNDLDSRDARHVGLTPDFNTFLSLEELCLVNLSSKIWTFLKDHCVYCPNLQKMNIIFSQNHNHWPDKKIYKLLTILLFNYVGRNNGIIGTGDNNESKIDIMSRQASDHLPSNGTGNMNRNTSTNSSSDNGSSYSNHSNNNNNSSYNDCDLLSMVPGCAESEMNEFRIFWRDHRPKWNEKYLNIISIANDIEKNVALLQNVEKAMLKLSRLIQSLPNFASIFGINHNYFNESSKDHSGTGGGIYGSGDDTIDVSMSENSHRSKSGSHTPTGTLNPINPTILSGIGSVSDENNSGHSNHNSMEFKTNFRKINYPKMLSSHHGGYHSHANKIRDKERELRIVSDILEKYQFWLHLHIDVECDDFAQIRKFMKVIKQPHFTYNQASYHVIARKKMKSEHIQDHLNQKNGKQNTKGLDAHANNSNLNTNDHNNTSSNPLSIGKSGHIRRSISSNASQLKNKISRFYNNNIGVDNNNNNNNTNTNNNPTAITTAPIIGGFLGGVNVNRNHNHTNNNNNNTGPHSPGAPSLACESPLSHDEKRRNGLKFRGRNLRKKDNDEPGFENFETAFGISSSSGNGNNDVDDDNPSVISTISRHNSTTGSYIVGSHSTHWRKTVKKHKNHRRSHSTRGHGHGNGNSGSGNNNNGNNNNGSTTNGRNNSSGSSGRINVNLQHSGLIPRSLLLGIGGSGINSNDNSNTGREYSAHRIGGAMLDDISCRGLGNSGDHTGNDASWLQGKFIPKIKSFMKSKSDGDSSVGMNNNNNNNSGISHNNNNSSNSNNNTNNSNSNNSSGNNRLLSTLRMGLAAGLSRANTVAFTSLPGNDNIEESQYNEESVIVGNNTQSETEQKTSSASTTKTTTPTTGIPPNKAKSKQHRDVSNQNGNVNSGNGSNSSSNSIGPYGNQLLRLVKNTQNPRNVHWACQCKFSQCSHEFRTNPGGSDGTSRNGLKLRKY